MTTYKPILTPYQFLTAEVRPALARMEPKFQGSAAECMLTAIPTQESDFRSLYQIGKDGRAIHNLARGFYQFEMTGVRAVIRHPSCRWLAPFLVKNGFLTPTPEVIHFALPGSSSLQVWLARANLWWYPHSLVEPVLDFEHEEAAWQQYLEIWRPGKPHRELWGRAWKLAVEAVNIPTMPGPTEKVLSSEPEV